MKKTKFLVVFLVGTLIGILSTQDLATMLEHFGWRAAEIRASVKYTISLPEKLVFIPQGAVSPPLQTTSSISTATKANSSPTAALPGFTQTCQNEHPPKHQHPYRRI